MEAESICTKIHQEETLKILTEKDLSIMSTKPPLGRPNDLSFVALENITWNLERGINSKAWASISQVSTQPMIPALLSEPSKKKDDRLSRPSQFQNIHSRFSNCYSSFSKRGVLLLALLEHGETIESKFRFPEPPEAWEDWSVPELGIFCTIIGLPLTNLIDKSRSPALLRLARSFLRADSSFCWDIERSGKITKLL